MFEIGFGGFIGLVVGALYFALALRIFDKAHKNEITMKKAIGRSLLLLIILEGLFIFFGGTICLDTILACFVLWLGAFIADKVKAKKAPKLDYIIIEIVCLINFALYIIMGRMCVDGAFITVLIISIPVTAFILFIRKLIREKRKTEQDNMHLFND